MKKLFYYLLPIMALVTLAFAGCSNNDDDDSSLAFDKATVVGTWEITNAGSSTWHWIREGATLNFSSDGSCKTDFSMENAYKIEGGAIKTYEKSTNEPMLVYVLLSVNSNIYTVKVYGTLDESNMSVTIQMKKK